MTVKNFARCLLGTRLLLLVAVLAVDPATLFGQPPAARPSKNRPADDLDALLDGTNRGTRFRLVTAGREHRGLDDVLFWRTLPRSVAAETAPVLFRLSGENVIAPKLESEGDDPTATSYPTVGYAQLKDGKYVLQPGDIEITVQGGGPSSEHPAIAIASTKAGKEVQILCAPVRLQVVDERGAPVAAGIDVACGGKSLLRERANFTALVIWLPVGARYTTNLGSFRLEPDGKIKLSGSLPKGVEPTECGLRRVVPAQPAAPSAAPVANLVELPLTLPKDTEVPAAQIPKVTVFVTPVTRPGEPIWLAVSRKQFRLVTEQEFALEQFTASVSGSPFAQPHETAPPGDAALRSLAARTLHDSDDGLAWFTLPMPRQAIGPVSGTLRCALTGPAGFSVLAADLGQGLQLVPYRWRTAFTDREQALYQVLIAGGQNAGKAIVKVQRTGSQAADGQSPDDVQPQSLGELNLPAVEPGAADSRLFTLDTRDLPPGDYQLWVEAGQRHSGKVPLSVVSWLRRSPLLVHSMSGCTACWPTSEEGLALLEEAGIETVNATGASSELNTAMPAIDQRLAGQLMGFDRSLAAELALRPAPNDRLLGDLLRHRLRMIDLTVVRAYGMYNEGLSYHHSYRPSVERMIRRMQIFTQQTADYPSFWGVNYAWFPQLGGYVEGGVPTDPHTADRNRVLAENVAAAGHKPLTPDERRWLDENRLSDNPQTRAKVLKLVRQAADHFRARESLGWGKHNQLYNAAVRAVKPDAVCTLYDNAGHDAHKRTRDLFRDMAAACYESYTDFGDWPMSAAFTTDWAKGNSPGQPVWLTTCWGTSVTGKMKSLFHALARGLDGAGVPMQATFEMAELAHRSQGLKLAGQYGPVFTEAQPERRVAILCRTAKQALASREALYQAHALYYHLTRLGYPPVLVADEEVMAAGVPPHVQVLLLADEKWPLEAETEKALAAFMERGGKVISVGDDCITVPGATAIQLPLRHIWEMEGFHPETFQALWKEFDEVWRRPLGDAMHKTGLVQLATTDAERGYALTLDAGPVRYVVVIEDAAGAHSNTFSRPHGLGVSVEGTGWQVRDLVAQQDVPSKVEEGRTLVELDLATEPTALLALYRAAPDRVEPAVSAAAQLGDVLSVSAVASTADGKTNLGPVPLKYMLTGPDGRQRGPWYRAAGSVMQVPLPRHDDAGSWRLATQELLTGLTATAAIEVAPATGSIATVAQVGPVHVVNPQHLAGFAAHPGEKLVIVEPDQQHLLPIARRLTDALVASGVAARLWQVGPEQYDMIPQRWYPRSDDEARLAAVAAGELVGYRGAMRPYIDKLKREHVPELGGYTDVGPPYMVGQDCIVFSGGALAESLRDVTAWMETPNVPGRGQGRLVVCFSPFAAGRQVAAVVANDVEGLGKAADRLAAAFQTPAEVTVAEPATQQPVRLKPVAGKNEAQAVARPYRGFAPLERIERLLATCDGQAAVLLSGDADNLAMVDAQGHITATRRVGDVLPAHAQLDAQGRLVLMRKTTLEKHPGWGFPTAVEVLLSWIAPDGSLQRELVAYSGTTSLPPGYEASFAVASGADAAVLGRERGLLLRGSSGTWRFYDDLPHVRKRFEVIFPRFPVTAAFSPEGRYVAVTFDTRPPFGAFSNGPLQPTAAETVLIDVETGQRVWALRDDDYRKPTYATHQGFAAVSADGRVTALADYGGTVYLIDKSGKILLSEQTTVSERDQQRIGPPGGIGTWISDEGQTALFAFQNLLVLARPDGTVVRLPAALVEQAALAPDGSTVFVAQHGGRLAALDNRGQPLWEREIGGRLDLATTAGGGVLVATGEGQLLRLDATGGEQWATDLAAAADRQRNDVTPAADYVRLPLPDEYREPPTLALVKKPLGAKQVAAWVPTGKAAEAHGRIFYLTSAPITLESQAPGEYLVHVVYRRPAENKSLHVVTRSKASEETFDLDLATPAYRVVDIPLRGPGASVTVTGDGPVEIAECSLWSFRWPSVNYAYIAPAASGLDRKTAAKKSDDLLAGDDILAELTGKSTQDGAIKKSRVWWPNSDPDEVAGPWLRAPLDPTQIVDGKRFGKVNPWSSRNGNFAPTRGAFFTIDFGAKKKLGLVATYDRAVKQSEVSRRLALFSGGEPDSLTTGTLLGGDTDNDQFWRIFPLSGEGVPVLGVHVFRDPDSPEGLSEIEAYERNH